MLVDFDFKITVTGIVGANRLRNLPTDTAIHRRSRQRWAVVLKTQGKTQYLVNGREVFSDSQHPVILPRGSSYDWRCVEPGDCLIIEFDAPEESTEIFSFSLTDNSFFRHDFLKIQKVLHDPSPEARLEGIHRLYGLLLQLVKTTAKEYVPREKLGLIHPAVTYITEKYYLPDITNDDLAQLCGISTVYFRKCFEAAFGVSPIRYLHNIRIQKAKDILSSDYGSIARVAESVGYNSVYHFSKMFKLYTGTSPSEYTKTNRD